MHAAFFTHARAVLRYLPPVHFPLPPAVLLSAFRAAVSPPRSLRDATQGWLRDRFPNRAITLTESGTSALALAIARSGTASSRGKTSGALVALPAFGCPDLGAAAIAAGARVTLYDLDPETLQPDEPSVADALDRGASHVVVAHWYGRASNISMVAALAAKAEAVLIEDAAQGADASWNGVGAGNLSSWSIMSLGRGKGYNAGGGGILLSPEAYPVHGFEARTPGAPASALWHAATTMLTQILSHPLLYGVPARVPALGVGETRYHAAIMGRPIANGAVALLVAAFEQSTRAAGARRERERQYLEALADATGLLLPRPDARSVSGALRVPVLVHEARVAHLHRYGVVRSYPRVLGAYPEIAAHLVGPASLPGAALLSSAMHTLPTHGLLRPTDLDHIIRVLRDKGGARPTAP